MALACLTFSYLKSVRGLIVRAVTGIALDNIMVGIVYGPYWQLPQVAYFLGGNRTALKFYPYEKRVRVKK